MTKTIWVLAALGVSTAAYGQEAKKDSPTWISRGLPHIGVDLRYAQDRLDEQDAHRELGWGMGLGVNGFTRTNNGIADLMVTGHGYGAMDFMGFSSNYDPKTKQTTTGARLGVTGDAEGSLGVLFGGPIGVYGAVSGQAHFQMMQHDGMAVGMSGARGGGEIGMGAFHRNVHVSGAMALESAHEQFYTKATGNIEDSGLAARWRLVLGTESDDGKVRGNLTAYMRELSSELLDMNTHGVAALLQVNENSFGLGYERRKYEINSQSIFNRDHTFVSDRIYATVGVALDRPTKAAQTANANE